MEDPSLLPATRAALAETFGYGEFRPGQEAVIGHLLAGRSAAAVFPTGGGKSLCYQIPALLLPGLTLVVSPLIALMKDQIDQLTRRGVAAGRLDSTLTGDEVRALMEAVRQGALRLLYVAPERFNNERFREAISRVRVSLFAVDEAHCVSEWGHNFRPDYLKLAGFGRLCGAERTLALTATATPQVLADVCRGFGIAPECAVRTGFHRENLTLRFTPVHAAGRDNLLLERFSSGLPKVPPSSMSPCRRRPRTWPRPWRAPDCRPSPTTPAWRTPSAPGCRTASWSRRTRWSSPPSPLAWGSTRRTSAR